ncbi:MAG: EamA family transporter [Bacteroidetes bacterium]|nr:MAG: EamA family transporter [Bacteroidota bacterium]
MSQNPKYNQDLLLLHFIVLILSFTAILGKLITIDADNLVWYRMIIAFFGIAGYLKFKNKSASVTRKQLLQYLGVGAIIAAHWYTFFESIKISNVSITLVALSVTSLFVALMQPLFFKRKIVGYEVFLSLLTIVGIATIFNVESQYTMGLILGLLSALLAALFSLFNARLIAKNDATVISLYEMLGGVTIFTLIFLFTGKFDVEFFQVSQTDWGWLLILGLVCTSFAYVGTIKVLRHLSPFTVSISINLEPVYGIILALLIFGESEAMNPAFYFGGGIILVSILLNAWFKKRAMKNGPASNE